MKCVKIVAVTVMIGLCALVGSGLATAEPPPPPQIDLTQPLMTPTDDGNSQVATALFPENDPKQTSFDDMTREIDIGWNNGGMAGAAIGAYAGMAIGCVSIFPNFIAGCIIGNVVGTVVGAVVGIGYGNPDAQPAVEQFLSTP